jgi:tRNA threonylcarbamoyladenosine modification (KEOPS) complex  Pcc1 subunit
MNNPDYSLIAIIRIELNEKLPDIIEVALGPETKTPSSNRSETIVKVENNELVIHTQASDTTALRAALNSYLRWVDGIRNIMDCLE